MTNEELFKLVANISRNSDGYTDYPDPLPDTIVSAGFYKFCYVFTKEDFVVKFSKRTRKDGRDVCEQEMKNYAKAVELGVERVLLKIEFLGENEHGIKFYKQEKADLVFESIDRQQKTRYQKMTKTVKKKIVRKTISITHIDPLWMGTVISLYGKKFSIRFAEWLKVQQVTDLHGANLGFKNHRPVIFDYGGVL